MRKQPPRQRPNQPRPASEKADDPSGHLYKDFHDAGLISFNVGPRRELILELYVLVHGPGPQLPSVVSTVRFGAIDNISEVRAFFASLPSPKQPDAFWDTVEEIARCSTGFNIALDHAGSVVVRTSKSPLIKDQPPNNGIERTAAVTRTPSCE